MFTGGRVGVGLTLPPGGRVGPAGLIFRLSERLCVWHLGGMKELNTVTIQWLGKPRTLRVLAGEYENNNALALVLQEEDGEHFGTLSVNLDESAMLPPDVFYLKDWSENGPLYREFERLGHLIEAPEFPEVQTGFVTCRAYRWEQNPNPNPQAFAA